MVPEVCAYRSFRDQVPGVRLYKHVTPYPYVPSFLFISLNLKMAFSLRTVDFMGIPDDVVVPILLSKLSKFLNAEEQTYVSLTIFLIVRLHLTHL